MNIQRVSQKFSSVRCFVREIFEKMFYSNLAMYREAMFMSLQQPEDNKNMSSSFL